MNTKTILTAVTLLTLLVPLYAQGERLQRAILIEEQERDDKQAARLYREIAEDQASKAAERTVAWYRLGRVLQRTGAEAEARRAFTAAAEGTGPMAEAAKQLLRAGGPESDHERQLRAAARSILETGPGTGGEKLLWIGEPAVPEICARFESEWRSGNPGFAEIVWKIGGKRAEEFLRGVLARGDVRYKRAMAQSVPVDYHPGLLDVALDFMDDESLSEENVVFLAERLAVRAPIERLVKLTDAKRSGIAVNGWRILGNRVGVRAAANNPAWVADMAAIEPAVGRSLGRSDAVVAAGAVEFLRACGTRTRSGLQKLLEILPSWPRMVAPSLWSPTYPVPATDLVEVARKLGPRDPQDQRAKWLAIVVRSAWGKWGADSLEPAVELARLGYFDHFGNWLQGTGAHLRAGSKIVQDLADTRELFDVASILSGADLGESDWPILHRCWQRFGYQGRPDWLFTCIGRTGAAPALGFLEDGLRSPDLFDAAVGGLIAFSQRVDSAAVRAALRSAVRAGRQFSPPKNGWRPFHRCIQLGDPEVVSLVPEVKELAENVVAEFIERWQPSSQEYVRRHGYGDEELAAAWSRLLDVETRYWDTAVLTHDGRSLGGRNFSLPNRSHVRPAVAEMLTAKCEALVTVWLESGSPPPPRKVALLAAVLNLPGHWSRSTPAVEQRLQALATRCVTSSEQQLQMAALAGLEHREPTPEQRAAVLRLSKGRDEAIAETAFAVISGRVVLTEREFTDLLNQGSSKLRERLLGSYLVDWKGRVDLQAILPALADANAMVRVMVCKYLGRRADTGAVAPLLGVLRDPQEGVRTAARDALQAIRFYHDQQAHWDRMFKGPRTDANTAAERLVQQAGPGEEKAVRLVAIRSLGLLGKVEVVPFLIEFGKEKDPEVSAAAKQAIETALAKAGGK